MVKNDIEKILSNDWNTGESWLVEELVEYVERELKKERQKTYKEIQKGYIDSNGDFEFVNYQMGLELLDDKSKKTINSQKGD